MEKRNAKGIKCTNYTTWKLNGFYDTLKTVGIGLKLTLFRTFEVLNKHRKKYNRN